MIRGIDHVVLTVSDIERAAAFYVRVLGLRREEFAGGRVALHFGDQKINLQTLGQETRNRAAVGSGDLCLVTDWPPERVRAHLEASGVDVLEGPVAKSGAQGPVTSVYFTDPDGNLIEVAGYAEPVAPN